MDSGIDLCVLSEALGVVFLVFVFPETSLEIEALSWCSGSKDGRVAVVHHADFGFANRLTADG